MLSSELHFPSYRKVAEHRDSIILRHLIQPYPTVVNPIVMHVLYAQYVRHTFLRIMSTLPPPLTQDFPLQLQISDGLDGSGGHTVYNQTIANTETKDCDLITQVFPINRHISDALPLLGDLDDSESFLKLPSNERFNITHEPL